MEEVTLTTLSSGQTFLPMVEASRKVKFLRFFQIHILYVSLYVLLKITNYRAMSKTLTLHVTSFHLSRSKVTDAHMFIIAGELMEAIKRDFGSFQKMQEKLSAATVAVQGSGWGWLGYDKESGRLRVAACANQDPLQGTTGQLEVTSRKMWAPSVNEMFFL